MKSVKNKSLVLALVLGVSLASNFNNSQAFFRAQPKPGADVLVGFMGPIMVPFTIASMVEFAAIVRKKENLKEKFSELATPALMLGCYWYCVYNAFVGE